MSAKAATPTIDDLIRSYLDTLSPADRADVEGSLDLLRSGLDGYGHQHLTPAEARRWAIARAEDADADEELPFTQVFGARQLAKYLDEFFGYFLIRKVILSAEQVDETIEHVRGFVGWLAATGALTPAVARKALGRAAQASDELPAAEALGGHLYELAKRTTETAAARRVAYDEIVDDFLVVERVAPGRLWFLDGVGPIKVPEAASRVARAGWTINLVLGRSGDRWDVLEVGNVYPETLA